MKNISTCLWFNDQAEAAAKFYATVFDRVDIGPVARYPESGAEVSGQKAGSVMTVPIRIENIEVEALNGGPHFKFTPAVSYFVACASEAEITEKWRKLSAGGQVRMGLDKYPWAEKYAWTADKFGVEWQLILSPRPQKIAPCLLFVDRLFGQGQAALDFYTSIFPNSKIGAVARDEKTNALLHAGFTLNGQDFALMDGGGTHNYSFNEATSFVVNCDTQAEVDTYWSRLLAGGGSESQCGWLKDRFGVSWQVVPRELGALMADPQTADKAFRAMVNMRKLDLARILAAVNA